MSDRNSLLQTLNTQLAQEATLLRQLLDSMQQEHQCLLEKALDKLTATVEQKKSLLNEFDTAVTCRMETLTNLGHNSQGDTQSTTRLMIQECGKDDPAILDHWTALEELLLQCKEQNEINGAIIEVSSHSLQTAYTLLTRSNSDEADLYNAKGVSRKGGGAGNSLAKA